MSEANYNYTEWRGLDPMEKALHVAHYRLGALINVHGQDAVNDYYERQAKRNKK